MNLDFRGFLGPFDELENQKLVLRSACAHTEETCVSLGIFFLMQLYPASVCSASNPANGHGLVSCPEFRSSRNE